MRLKVLNKEEIEQLLSQGNILRYATIQGKVYVQDKHWNTLGAVRFDTYLNMVKSLVKISSPYQDDLYIKGTMFADHKVIGRSNGRLKHSMQIITTEEINISNKEEVYKIVRQASEQSSYNPDAYGFSSPVVIKSNTKGYYLATWESSQSCD